MSGESQNCPKCGAPLRPTRGEALTFCLYCGSAIRLQPGKTPGPADVAATLSAEDMAQVRHALAAGRRAEALALYRERTGAEAAEAEAALADLGRQLSANIIRSQQLTRYGVFFVGLSVLAAGLAVAAAARGRLSPLVAAFAAAWALWNLSAFAPSIATSLRYLNAPRAPAQVLKLAPVGTMKLRTGLVHTFKVLLDVQPEGAPAFRAEMLLPVRERNLARAQPGTMLRVRYLASDPSRVIYDGRE